MRPHSNGVDLVAAFVINPMLDQALTGKVPNTSFAWGSRSNKQIRRHMKKLTERLRSALADGSLAAQDIGGQAF